MSHSVKAECRLAVLGASCVSLEPGESGVGKSSLCSRFIRPDVDSWDELGYDHSHWLSQSDFQEPEINGDHFVYFGAATRLYQPRGRAKSDAVELRIHVVEHTTFLDDSLSRPFPGSGDYAKRATNPRVTSSSPGKTAYSCRAQLGEDAPLYSLRVYAVEQLRFPAEYSARTGGVDGYLFVLDPSKSAAQRDWQWRCFTDCWSQLPDKKKKCCAVALAKCETLPKSVGRLDKTFDVLDRFQCTAASKKQKSSAFQACPGKLAISDGKHRIPVFFTSAALCYGVDMPFLYLAHRSLKLSGSPRPPITWSIAMQQHNDVSKGILLSAHAHFRKHVKSHTTTWSDMVHIYRDQAMEDCRVVHGSQVCQSLFKSHLLLLAVGAAEQMLKQDIEREQMYGVAAGSVAMDTAMRATRMGSYTVRLTKEHPDLQDLVKQKDDNTGIDYDRFLDHTRDIHATARAILGQPSTILPTESDSDSEEEKEHYEEVGELVGRRQGQAEDEDAEPLYESIVTWKAFDKEVMYAWEKLAVLPGEGQATVAAPRNRTTARLEQSSSPVHSQNQAAVSPACSQHQAAANPVDHALQDPAVASSGQSSTHSDMENRAKSLFPFSRDSLYARAPPTSPRVNESCDHLLALLAPPKSDACKTSGMAMPRPRSPVNTRSGDSSPLSSTHAGCLPVSALHDTESPHSARRIGRQKNLKKARHRSSLPVTWDDDDVQEPTLVVNTAGRDGCADHDGGAQDSQPPQLDEFGYVRLCK